MKNIYSKIAKNIAETSHQLDQEIDLDYLEMELQQEGCFDGLTGREQVKLTDTVLDICNIELENIKEETMEDSYLRDEYFRSLLPF